MEDSIKNISKKFGIDSLLCKRLLKWIQYFKPSNPFRYFLICQKFTLFKIIIFFSNLKPNPRWLPSLIQLQN